MSEENQVAAEEETKALATVVQGGALVTQDDDIDFAADAGSGFENVTNDMKIIPFLRVLQDLSPQTKKTRKEYIEGAKPGQFWETATNSFFDGEAGVPFIPISVAQKWIEWVPRDSGGGIVRRWDDNSFKNMSGYVKADKGSKIITPEGNEIIEYLDVFGFLVTDEEQGIYIPVVLSTKSTSIQAVKSLITMADQLRIAHPQNGKRFRPAMYYSVFRAKLKEQSNEEGTWYGLSFVRQGDTVGLTGGRDIYRSAQELQKGILEGTVGVRDEDTDDRGEGGARAHDGATADEVDAI